MCAGNGGVWAIGVRVGSGASGRCRGGGDEAGGVLGGGVARSLTDPGERLPRALRALGPDADRAGVAGAAVSRAGSVGGR
jgi:hypothetical protein